MHRQASARLTTCLGWTAALALAAGCSGIDTFRLIHLATTPVPGAARSPNLAGSLDFGAFHPADNPDLAGVKRSEIDSIRIQEVWLQVIDPVNGQDLSFLDAIDIYVSATDQQPKLVATSAAFAKGVNPVKLQHASADLTDFALAEEMRIRADAQGSAPPQNSVLEAHVEMLVDVVILGF